MVRDYVVFDLETTGLSPARNEIIEIGALKVRDGRVSDRFSELVKPFSPVPDAVAHLTGISNEMLENARPAREVVPDFVRFCGDDILVGHNLMFDFSFTKKTAGELGLTFEHQGIDTLKISRRVLTDLPSRSLGALCDHYGIVNSSAHRAYHDALATARVYQTLAHYYEAKAPEAFVPRELHWKAPKSRPMTKKQKDYLKVLCKYHRIEFNESMEEMTMSQASRLIDKIILTHGRMAFSQE